MEKNIYHHCLIKLDDGLKNGLYFLQANQIDVESYDRFFVTISEECDPVLHYLKQLSLQ